MPALGRRTGSPERSHPTTTKLANATGMPLPFSSTAGLHTLVQDSPPAEVLGPSGNVYRAKSLGCLRPADEPRRSAIFLIEAPRFDTFILLAIVANCAQLAWQSPLDPPGTRKAAIVDAAEIVFLLIFTFELCAKVPPPRSATQRHAAINARQPQQPFF